MPAVPTEDAEEEVAATGSEQQRRGLRDDGRSVDNDAAAEAREAREAAAAALAAAVANAERNVTHAVAHETAAALEARARERRDAMLDALIDQQTLEVQAGAVARFLHDGGAPPPTVRANEGRPTFLLCCTGSAIAKGDGLLVWERRLGNGAGSSVEACRTAVAEPKL